MFVSTEFATYTVGRERPMPLVPVSENVSLELFDVPVIVRVPPLWATAAVSSMFTNSAAPAWLMVSVLLSTPDAEKVAVVERAVRPVWLLPVQATVSLPLPDVLLGVTHDAYAISYAVLVVLFYEP